MSFALFRAVCNSRRANPEATKETEEVTEQLIWGTNEYLAGLKIASSGPFSSHFVTFPVPS